MRKLALSVHRDLFENRINSFYDASGSIGKRYRRQDEIGTMYCVTIDYDSLEDNSVTLRIRDTMKQDRVNINELVEIIRNKLRTFK